MSTTARIAGSAAVTLACALSLVATAGSAPKDDYQAVLADYQADSQITPCRFSRQQLQNADANTPPDVDLYAPAFRAQVRAEIRRHDSGGCPASGGNSATRLTTTLTRPRVTARQVGGRIKVKATGRIAKRGQACNGKVAVAVRSGGKRRARKNGTVRSSCRYVARLSFSVSALPSLLEPRSSRLLVKVSTRYAGTSTRKPDRAPARIARVRR